MAQLDVIRIRQREKPQKIRRRHESLNESVEKLLTDGMQSIRKLANDLGKLGSHVNEPSAHLIHPRSPDSE
ncbi:MAG: hypothetical protein GWP74_14040 [Proteobacteria bacterium]|nr:hypothetical protein [Pseudomonadota bacterium]